MVNALMLIFLIGKLINVTERVDFVEIRIKGPFESFNVTEFPYEGAIAVDVKGGLRGFQGAEQYENSFLRSIEYRRLEFNSGRIIFRFAGPVQLMNYSYSGSEISLNISTKGARVGLAPSVGEAPSRNLSREVRVVRETVFVDRPTAVFLKFRNLNASELSEFVKFTTGVDIRFPDNFQNQGAIEGKSVDEFLKELKKSLNRNAR